MFGGVLEGGADCFSKGDAGTAAGSFGGDFGSGGVACFGAESASSFGAESASSFGAESASSFGAESASSFGATFVSGEDCIDADKEVALLIVVLWVGVDNVRVTFLNGSKS